MEGVVKYARLNYFVPVPAVKDFEELNAHLEQRCWGDLDRKLRGKGAAKGQAAQGRPGRVPAGACRGV